MFLLFLGLVLMGIFCWIGKIKREGKNEKEVFYFSEKKFKKLKIELNDTANKYVNKNYKLFEFMAWNESNDKYIKEILINIIIINDIVKKLYDAGSNVNNKSLGSERWSNRELKWGDLEIVANKAKFKIFELLDSNDKNLILSNLSCIAKSIRTFYKEVWPSNTPSFSEGNFRINILAYALGGTSASMGLLQSDLKRNYNLLFDESSGYFKLNGGFIS